MNSIERRLLLGIALSVLAVFALLLGGGTVAVRQLNQAYVYTRLQADAEALLAALRPARDGSGLHLRERRLSPVYSQPLSGQYFVVLGLGEEPVRSRSLWDEILPVEPLRPGETRQSRIIGPDQQHLLLHVAGYQRDDQQLTIAVAEDITPLGREIRRYQLISAAAFLVILLLLLLAQRRVVRLALRQLDALRTEVQRIGSGEQRTLSETVPTEVRPLVREFNRLLGRLEQRLERSRNAVGNLAHALKTPLSLITSELERSAQPDRTLALNQVTRLRQLTDRELRRARIAGGGMPGRQFDAADDVPALLSSLEHLHRDRDLQLSADGVPAASLPLDREDMLELLGNLMDNACKWARSEVRLTFAQASGVFTITVEDDGPGVSGDDLPRISNRGIRIDEQAEGYGLGLAIVSDIVKVYDGEISFDRSPHLGGLRVIASVCWERE